MEWLGSSARDIVECVGPRTDTGVHCSGRTKLCKNSQLAASKRPSPTQPRQARQPCLQRQRHSLLPRLLQPRCQLWLALALLLQPGWQAPSA